MALFLRRKGPRLGETRRLNVNVSSNLDLAALMTPAIEHALADHFALDLLMLGYPQSLTP